LDASVVSLALQLVRTERVYISAIVGRRGMETILPRRQRVEVANIIEIILCI
jgi:hypothetical protein